jgi:hypothetical protein
MSQVENSRSKFFLFAFLGIAFLLLYIFLSSNNRYAADDYYYLKNVRDSGVWNGMIISYTTWVTRWTALLFLNVIFLFNDLFHSLLPYQIFTLTALWTVLIVFMKVIDQRFFHFGFSTVVHFIYTLILIASFFFFSFSVAETWFWITSTSMYLWSIIFFLAGVALILSLKKKMLVSMCCAACFIFIGGASESMAISIGVFLFVTIIYHVYKRNNPRAFLSSSENILLIIAFISLAVSLLITYAGPGRMIRQSALPDTTVLNAVFITIKSVVKLLLFYLPVKIHWIIFFIVPWIYLGSIHSSDETIFLEKIFLRVVQFVLVFLVVSFICLFPVSWLLGESGPFRAWILVTLALSFFCAASGFYIGRYTQWNKKYLSRIVYVTMVAAILFLVIIILDQQKAASAYSEAVDGRMKILKVTRQKETIVLESLPPSGMLYSAEISDDSSHFTNKHLQNYLQLNSFIRKK